MWRFGISCLNKPNCCCSTHSRGVSSYSGYSLDLCLTPHPLLHSHWQDFSGHKHWSWVDMVIDSFHSGQMSGHAWWAMSGFPWMVALLLGVLLALHGIAYSLMFLLPFCSGYGGWCWWHSSISTSYRIGSLTVKFSIANVCKQKTVPTIRMCFDSAAYSLFFVKDQFE